MRASRLAIFVIASALGTACSGTVVVSNDKACVPGQSAGCVGPGGCLGAQVCRADGSGFDTCACRPVDTQPDGSSTETGMDDALAEVPTDSGPDPTKDNDGDGYRFADDCDDTNPAVNPGAYEIVGDGVDNDCNAKVDDVDDCDTSTDVDLYKTTDALEFAKALGLCHTAKPDATGKEKTWGVLSAALVRTDGTPITDQVQYGLLRKFGTAVTPRAGKNMVVLSSGTARTPEYPEFHQPRTDSFSSASATTAPPGWPKSAPSCAAPTTTTANDSVNLKLTIRVPTNAKSFAFDLDFYTSEYISYVCSAFNDNFVALLDSKMPLDPKYSGNITFDSMGEPISVNSRLLEVCTPGSKGSFTYPCPRGTSELDATGFWPDADTLQNAATSWLTTHAPVQPGEEITIQFMIWDTGDHILDSTVLLDNWRWDTAAAAAPTTDRPK